MTLDQGLLFGLFGLVLIGMLSNRFRHDLVAMAGLLVAVTLGLVPQNEAFSGFANPAVVVVALVLVASVAFENTGALGLLATRLTREGRSIPVHIAILGGFGAGLSAVINNVAALAILMPLDIQAARKAGRAPSLTLMCLAFATILGGMVTLIGTPPNIIASAIREQKLGEAYGMFSFTPVGLAVALAGIAFVALIGWRLIPSRDNQAQPGHSSPSFMAELTVGKDSELIGQRVMDLEKAARDADVFIIGARDADGRFDPARWAVLQKDSLLVVKGATDAIASFVKSNGLAIPPEPENEADEAKDERRKELLAAAPEIIEVVIPADSMLVGQQPSSLRLRDRFGVVVLAVRRGRATISTEISHQRLRAGDMLLITGQPTRVAPSLELMGLVPVSREDVSPVNNRDISLVVLIFLAALALATSGVLSFTIAIAIAVTLYVALGFVPMRDLYRKIEWPVIVMLACLLPIGQAFDRLGGTALVAQTLSDITQAYPPIVALIAVMIVTMTLSDVLNNVATIVVMGPVAIDLAGRLDANPDTFLMGTAIAASCAFLTPIGHKNNTLVMGPGGYGFGDYWRMGLPLELIVLAVAVPMLMLVYPL